MKDGLVLTFINKMADFKIFRLFTISIVVLITAKCFGETAETDGDLKEICEGNIDGCYCTEQYVDCREVEFSDISDIYPFITDKTYRIRITDGNILSLPENLFTSDSLPGPLTEVKYLNLSGNHIVSISGNSFNQLTSLTVLDLSNNELFIELCDTANALSTALFPLAKLEELYLGHVLSSEDVGVCDAGNILPQTKMENLQKLDLSLNDLNMAGESFENVSCGPVFLTYLNLSGNNFSQFPVPPCMVNLQYLDVSNNNLMVISPDEQDVIDSLVNLKMLRLGGNTFSCDCYFQDTLDWLKMTDTPLDFEEIRCQNQQLDDKLRNQIIKHLNFTDMCEGPRIVICPGPFLGKVAVARSTFIAIIAAVAVVLITAVTAIVICRRRRRNARSSSDTTSTKSHSYSRMV